MKKILLFALVLAMVALSAGCDGTTNPPVTPTTTTTSTTTADATTTAADTTTAVTTTTSETVTTTTAPQQAEPALQIGGATFTLDGVTFKMGEAPDKLLAHLGEPNETKYGTESVYGYIWVTYYYDHLVVETCSQHEPSRDRSLQEQATNQILAEIYFVDNHYSFDGISVGDTAAELDEKISVKLTPTGQPESVGLYGGCGYRYDQDKESNDNADKTYWCILFPKDDLERFVSNNFCAFPDMKISYIKIAYVYY